MTFSVCVLLFGNRPDWACRCLASLVQSASERPEFNKYVQDVRIGLNNVSDATKSAVLDWLRTTQPADVWLVEPAWQQKPALKYPCMRRLFGWNDGQPTVSAPLADRVMWFDDDSYRVVGRPGWWSRVAKAADDGEVLGQVWQRDIAFNQWRWILSQAWADPNLPMPLPGRVRFLQGAWWCASTKLLQKLNWPWPELRHRGGDMLFGEACRHMNVPLRSFAESMLINAGDSGRHSGSPSRGCNADEQLLAVDYVGKPLPTDHQQFDCAITRYRGGKLCPTTQKRSGRAGK